MEGLYTVRTGFVLGFHGCDQRVLNKVVSGNDDLRESRNNYDWLGHGIYFWDNSPSRAAEYASSLKTNASRSKSPIVTPAVLGAVINLGYCLDLLDYANLKDLLYSYDILKKSHNVLEVPISQNRNVGDNKDLLLRNLDCAVIETLHQLREKANLPPYDSVRGVFGKARQFIPMQAFGRKITFKSAFATQIASKAIFGQENSIKNSGGCSARC